MKVRFKPEVMHHVLHDIPRRYNGDLITSPLSSCMYKKEWVVQDWEVTGGDIDEHYGYRLYNTSECFIHEPDIDVIQAFEFPPELFEL